MKRHFFSHDQSSEQSHCGRRIGFQGFRGPRFGGGGRFGGRDGLGFEGFGQARGDRGFGHGGLRLVILKLIAEKPSHGYELIKAIEDRFKGNYSPSPGVIYPTLSWLEDSGFVTVQPSEDGRKSYIVTEAGMAHLAEKVSEVERLFTMMDSADKDTHLTHRPVFRAMQNLHSVLRGRMMNSTSDKASFEAIVDMIDELAKKIERL